MPLVKCQVYEEELKYDNTLGISEGLLDELDYAKVGDGDYYMEMVKDNKELERKEGNRAWDEMDSVFLAYFVKQFPAQRKKIEKSIQRLQEIADDIDKTHKDCTIASIAANTTGASSGILNILGLTLAPFTAGGSLILTATGIGLGAVAAVTGISTSIYENVNNSKEKETAQELINECQKCLRKLIPTSEIDFRSEYLLNNEAVGENVKQLVVSAACQVRKMYRAAKGIRTNVKALKLAQNNPGLKALAKQATAVGSTSQCTIKGVENVKQAFGGTALAMTKGARMLSAATAGLFLLLGAYGIAQDAKHLKEGAKTETAAEIREEANKLEEQLHNLNRLYEELKDKIPKVKLERKKPGAAPERERLREKARVHLWTPQPQSRAGKREGRRKGKSSSPPPSPKAKPERERLEEKATVRLYPTPAPKSQLRQTPQEQWRKVEKQLRH